MVFLLEIEMKNLSKCYGYDVFCDFWKSSSLLKQLKIGLLKEEMEKNNF